MAENLNLARGREKNVTLTIETISTEALFALAAVVENPISTFGVGMTRMLTITTEVNWKYILFILQFNPFNSQFHQ